MSVYRLSGHRDHGAGLLMARTTTCAGCGNPILLDSQSWLSETMYLFVSEEMTTQIYHYDDGWDQRVAALAIELLEMATDV